MLRMLDSSLFTLASLAAHAKHQGRGFRQKDVKFLIDLFISWIYNPAGRATRPVLHNTQTQRYLNGLVGQGLARVMSPKTTPVYSLTKSGFLELTEELSKEARSAPFEIFLFLIYFIRSYRDQVLSTFDSLNTSSALAFKSEMKTLLDEKSLIQERHRAVSAEIEYWNARIAEAKSVISYVKDLRRETKDSLEIAKAVELRFPYELNFQKPLTELLSEVTPELQLWELTQGNDERIRHLWKQKIKLLTAERDSLETLQSETPKS